jgi:predicted nucleic acid-binding protein
MFFLDTNILARFIVGDVENQQSIVQKIFNDGNENKLKYYIVPEVLVELNYVLTSHYGFENGEIMETVSNILNLSFIEILTNYKLDFEKVIDFHLNKNLSLEDCLYLQICLENNLKLLTFDLKLKREWEKIVKLKKYTL